MFSVLLGTFVFLIQVLSFFVEMLYGTEIRSVMWRSGWEGEASSSYRVGIPREVLIIHCTSWVGEAEDTVVSGCQHNRSPPCETFHVLSAWPAP